MNELTTNNLDSKATRFLLDTCPSSDCTVKVLAVLVSELGAFLVLKWRPQPRPVTGCSMCGVLDASCFFASSPAWHILAVLPNVSATHRNSFCFIFVGSKNNLVTNHWIILFDLHIQHTQNTLHLTHHHEHLSDVINVCQLQLAHGTRRPRPLLPQYYTVHTTYTLPNHVQQYFNKIYSLSFLQRSALVNISLCLLGLDTC